jgi:MFS family permease
MLITAIDRTDHDRMDGDHDQPSQAGLRNMSAPTDSPPIAPTGPASPPTEGYVRFVLGMMLIVMVINSMDRTVLSILVQDIKADLSLDDRQMGLILGPAFAFFNLAAAFPLAAIADRGRRRLVIATGLLFWSLFTTFTALATGFWSLFLLRMGVGIGEASSSAPGQSLISSYVEPEKRSQSLSVIAIGSVLGLAIGMMLGGYVSEWWGWRTAFVVAGLPGIFFSVIFFRTIREPQNIEQPVSWMDTLREMLALRSYRWIIAGQATALFASMGRNLWEPTFLRRVYDMGAGEAGTWYFFTSPLPSAIGIYLGGRFADKLWKQDIRWSMWVPTIGQLACVPLLTLFLLWPEDHRLPFSSITGGFPVALLWSIPASLVGSFYAAPMLSMTQGLAPPAMRARAAVLAGAISGIVGSGMGPLLVGDLNVRLEPTYGEYAIRYSLLIVVLTTVASAACWYGASRSIRKDFEGRDERASPPSA